jgi:CheY-like chemotaxis protein
VFATPSAFPRLTELLFTCDVFRRRTAPHGVPLRRRFMASVLVVEDDAILAYALDRILTKAGHEVIGTAASFRKAISIAASAPPDLALVDFHLSGPENGALVAQHLRQLGSKIIFVTASADEVRLIDGSAEIVPKPFDDDALLKAVQRVIASAKSHD